MPKSRKPDHFLSKLLQTGALAGLTGLLYLDLATPGLTEPALPAFSQTAHIDETEYTAESVSESETAAALESESETVAVPESESEAVAAPESESETAVALKSESETVAVAESEAETTVAPESESEAPLALNASFDFYLTPETESEFETETEATPAALPSFPEGTVPTLEETFTFFQCPTLFQPLPGLAAQETWSELQATLEDMIASYDGTWSLCLKDLSTGRTILINDHPQASASLIKLYIAGAVLEKMNEDGQLPLLFSDQLAVSDVEDLRDLLGQMIIISSNDASNVLTCYLDPERRHQEGMALVNDFIRRHGFTDTIQYNGLGDPDYWYDTSTLNQTSAKDCVSFLEQVYDGTMVSHLASRFLESLLMDQTITYKIRDGLPAEAVTASKSGETNDTENDAAIVCTNGGDYILCILSTDLEPTENDEANEPATSQIRALSETIYLYFNPPETDEDSALSDRYMLIDGYTLVEYQSGSPAIYQAQEGAEE